MDEYFGLNLDLDDFERLLRDDELVEEPIPLERFVTDTGYLNMPNVHLSENQLEIIRRVTQIYKPHTLQTLLGEEEGLKYFKKYTVNEVISMLGKGSGKDFTTRVSFCYVIYLLFCLKNPIDYYNKAPGDNIDMLNLALNAEQANRVFFEPFKNMLANSPWFEGKYEPRRLDVSFWERPVRCFSGHSESEGWEGYNLLIAVLDEIAAFKTDGEMQGDIRGRHSATGIYKMSRRSVASRFPSVGKVVLLSFPRYAGDPIWQRYEEVIADKETLEKSLTLKVHDDLPDEEANQLNIEWEEDHITAYTYPKVWALRRPTWDVNPTITAQDLIAEFVDDYVDALGRFACMPPEMEDAYFRNTELVRDAFPENKQPPINEAGVFESFVSPDYEHPRYIHIDLASRFDRAAVAMVHSPGLIEVKLGNQTDLLPKIVIDAMRWWEAPKNGEINFGEVRDFIFNLQRMGYNIQKVTFDEWQSTMMMQEFQAKNIDCDKLIIKKLHYDNLAYTIYDRRLYGYDCPLAIEELLKLKLIRNKKVDHPSTGSKDLADAVCGAVYNCSQAARYDDDLGVDIKVLGTEEKVRPEIDNAIKVPEKREIPEDISEWLESIKMI